ncbi:hypothetical protein L3Q72_11340 [Vibrio sp. JC009]|uniref:hypothetical protein n=1 Tax=Vibrio sp. JC009 TaxID=2912314 RepID=UPI0023B17D78|nr:hypothetical protein [Vibrio sp. JC009]WED21230.1 hypothetical protein L3Q72_11340 [Vibrio sp. JC009]
MSVESTIIIILYSLKPYWWAVAAFILLPILCYVFRPTTFYIPGNISVVIGFVVGIIAAFATPYLTYSGFAYVDAIVDWVAIGGVILGATFYIWLNLQLLSKD